MSKKNFDTENILKFAKQIKLSQESEYIQQIKDIVIKEFKEPSPDFVKFLLSYFYDKEKVNSRTIEFFTSIVKKALEELQDD
jgi:hypothetical protein